MNSNWVKHSTPPVGNPAPGRCRRSKNLCTDDNFRSHPAPYRLKAVIEPRPLLNSTPGKNIRAACGKSNLEVCDESKSKLDDLGGTHRNAFRPGCGGGERTRHLLNRVRRQIHSSHCRPVGKNDPACGGLHAAVWYRGERAWSCGCAGHVEGKPVRHDYRRASR